MKVLVRPDDWGKEYNLGLYEYTLDAVVRPQKGSVMMYEEQD